MNTFFIAGVQRSGTTLLAVLLDKHPQILMERRSLAFRIISCFNSLNDILSYNLQEDQNELLQWLVANDDKGRLAELIDTDHISDNINIRSLIQESVDAKLKKEGKLLWGDKSPNLEYFFNDISLLMPESKVIHIVRDGRAVAHSMSSRSSRNLLWSAQKWLDGNIRALVNQRIVGKEKYQIIRYEDLITSPETVMRSICKFLQIPFSSEIINPEGEALDEDKKYVKSTFDKAKINNWENVLSEREIMKIEKIQGLLLQELGYDLKTPASIFKYQPLSVWRKIRYHQADNICQLFRSKRMGMVDRENVEIKISLKSRGYFFLKAITQDFLSTPIFKSLFPRVFYRKKFYNQDEKKQ